MAELKTDRPSHDGASGGGHPPFSDGLGGGTRSGNTGVCVGPDLISKKASLGINVYSPAFSPSGFRRVLDRGVEVYYEIRTSPDDYRSAVAEVFNHTDSIVIKIGKPWAGGWHL